MPGNRQDTLAAVFRFVGLVPSQLVGNDRRRSDPHQRLHARIEKLALEKAISNVPRLSDQLIPPLVAHLPVALPVNINAGSLAWRPSIEEHTKVHGGSSRHRSYDQM